MKAIRRIFSLITASLLTIAVGCKDANNDNETSDPEVSGESHVNDEKSRVTETGQHIGANRDSTTVDGESGSISNN